MSESSSCNLSTSDVDRRRTAGLLMMMVQTYAALAPKHGSISDMTHNDASVSGLFEARKYQDEMFRESMKRNIICAMDTGSGKTAM